MSDKKAPKDFANGFLARLRRYKIVGVLIIVGTIVGAIGTFAGAVTKIAEAYEKLFDPKPTSVAELQNIVLSTAKQAGQEFNAVTQGKEWPVARSEFAGTEKLLRRLSRLDPGNGHSIYYTGLIIRWAGDRPASHTVLFSYLDGTRQSGALQTEDDGGTKYCLDYWRGYCKQRAAWYNQLLALDFSEEAGKEKRPELALQWRQDALARAEAAMKLYGGFSDPKQGEPTVLLIDRLRKEIAAAQAGGTMPVSAPPAGK